jgi:TetR/AcrR family transcriptional regulator, fatty acid metabolism regulator protein
MGTSDVRQSGTFTQTARRVQLVDRAIASISELGYQRTSVAEVARRAGVSKGVVTYHFAARDDLIHAVVAEIFDSITTHVGTRLQKADCGSFVGVYIRAWVDYYRTHRNYMMAVAEIWTSFRDADGDRTSGVRPSSPNSPASNMPWRLDRPRGAWGNSPRESWPSASRVRSTHSWAS